MPLELVVLSSLVTLSMVGSGVYYAISSRYREAEPAWARVAADLGGVVNRRATSLVITAVREGRPIRVCAAPRGRGRSARPFTVITAALRHPDDILAATVVPPPQADAWTDAWRRAEGVAIDSARRLPRSPMATKSIEGVMNDATALHAAIDQHLTTIQGREQRVLAWRDAAASLGLRSTAAYVIEGSIDDHPISITADLLRRAVTIRVGATGHDELDTVAIAPRCPDALEYLEPVSEVFPAHWLFALDAGRATARVAPILARLTELTPLVLVAGTTGVVVTLDGVTACAPTWRRVLESCLEIA